MTGPQGADYPYVSIVLGIQGTPYPEKLGLAMELGPSPWDRFSHPSHVGGGSRGTFYIPRKDKLQQSRWLEHRESFLIAPRRVEDARAEAGRGTGGRAVPPAQQCQPWAGWWYWQQKRVRCSEPERRKCSLKDSCCCILTLRQPSCWCTVLPVRLGKKC